MDYLIRNPFLLRYMENWLFPKIDSFLVVSQYSKERVNNIFKSNHKPIWVVSNTPRLELLEKLMPHLIADKMKSYPGLVLLYTGMLDAGRGLDVAIRAIPEVLKEGLDLLLIIVGSGSSEGVLKLLASELKVKDHVFFAGWVDHTFIPSIIAASDICIIPHNVTEHTNTTIPNKIFDYMLLKKPVVVTNARPLKEIVLSHQCGRVYKDKDVNQLARILIELQNKDERIKMGESGFKAVKQKYNWSNDERILIDAVNYFIDRNHLKKK